MRCPRFNHNGLEENLSTPHFAHATYSFHQLQLHIHRLRLTPTPPATMDISQDRSCQPATSCGLGAHFTTPEKKRPGKRKTQVMTTTTFDAARKRQRLEAEIAEMLATELPVIPEEDSVLMDSGGPTGIADELKPVEEVGGSGPDSLDPTSNWEDSGFDYGFYQTHPQEFTDSNDNVSGTHAPIPTKGTRRRITPDQATTNLYEKWKASLPLLVDDLLAFMTASVGVAIQPVGSELEGRCCSSDVKTTKVNCLYFDRTSHHFL